MLSSRMMSAPASTACFTWSTVSASTSILRFGYLDQVKQAVEAGADIILLDKDRKSTRLNSSHRCTSYAVFCFKTKTGLFPLSVASSQSANLTAGCLVLD